VYVAARAVKCARVAASRLALTFGTPTEC
jgi:hypothetical protein